MLPNTIKPAQLICPCKCGCSKKKRGCRKSCAPYRQYKEAVRKFDEQKQELGIDRTLQKAKNELSWSDSLHRAMVRRIKAEMALQEQENQDGQIHE